MTTKQETCQERLNANYDSSVDMLRDLWEFYQEDSDGYHPEHETNMYEWGLSFDYVSPDTFKDQKEGYFRYQLSYGGPSDEFRIYAQKISDYRFSVYKLEYWFLDWYDGAHKVLQGDDYNLLEEVFECFFVECGTASHQLESAMSDL